MITTLGATEATAKREAALGLAEVGAQRALDRLNAAPHSASASPVWGVVSGARQEVFVHQDTLEARAGLIQTSGYDWRPTLPGVIRAETSGPDVFRRIEVEFRPVSMIENLALFALDSLNINASATQVIGNVGTNNTISGKSSTVTGDIVFCGSTPNITGDNVSRESATRTWPTAEALLVLYRNMTITQLASQNDNAGILMFNPANQSFLLSQAVPSGLTALNHDLSTQLLRNLSVTTNMHPSDAPGGTRYASETEGLYGRRVLILNPGDYYFRSVDLTGNQIGLLINNAKGPVNIFIHNASSGNDNIRAYCHIVSEDPRAFRIFYMKPGGLSMEGNSTLRCLIYAVSEMGAASVDFLGTAKLIGTIVAANVRLTGSVRVEQPATQTSTFGDPIWKYELTTNWRDVSQDGGDNYLDGGSR